MEKSLKDQALEAAQALEVKPVDDSSNPPEDNRGDSDPKPTEDPIKDPVEDLKPDEKKEEPKPPTFEVDGTVVTIDDIKKWREDSQNKNQWQTDLTQKAQEISSVKSTLDQIKDVFVKEKKEESLTPEEETFRKEADNLFKDPYVQNLIQSEIDKGIELKNQQQTLKQQEEEKKKFQENLTNEVKNLEKELGGDDGRPKYSDNEILLWQKENKKLYLSPREAYESKYRNELMEWEIQKRLKNQNGSPPKPTQTTVPQEKKVDGEKSSLPSDKFIRGKAMLEHLQSLTKEE